GSDRACLGRGPWAPIGLELSRYLAHGFPEIALGHDRVALVDGVGLVAYQALCLRPRHTRAFQPPHSRAPEVVRVPPWQVCPRASGPPGLVVAADGPARAMEQPRHLVALLPLKGHRRLILGLEKLGERRPASHRTHSPALVPRLR